MFLVQALKSFNSNSVRGANQIKEIGRRTMSSGNLPKVAGRSPIAVKLEKDKDYYWCTCGLSKNQPFCDGSHTKVEGFSPQKFTASETKEAHLCACKRTKNPPFCDGTHASLPDVEDLGGKSDHASSDSGGSGGQGTKDEPTLGIIKELARKGVEGIGEHGMMAAMGVRQNLPKWDDIQFVTAQMATKPLFDDDPVDTSVVIGKRAKKPLKLDIPLFVSDMSYGALSEEAKVALAIGAERSGTGICSGEGSMLPEENAENSKYFYELASAKFGFDLDLMSKVQAFHFKGGQAAKTGLGGHLPGSKVTEKIAKIRGLKPGQDAISPATFRDLVNPQDFKELANEVREKTGGIPIGFKISAQHIEKDIDFCLEASADYIIIDGRGGGTGSAPMIIRDNISVPTIPAIARARRYLDKSGASDVTLIATGGLRIPADFAKALALGADAIAVSNSALQSIGCVAARICHTGLCPASIATQDPEKRANFDIEKGSKQLHNFFQASTHLMKILARACGHSKLSDFQKSDLITYKKEMHELTGIHYAGFEEQ